MILAKWQRCLYLEVRWSRAQKAWNIHVVAITCWTNRTRRATHLKKRKGTEVYLLGGGEPEGLWVSKKAKIIISKKLNFLSSHWGTVKKNNNKKNKTHTHTYTQKEKTQKPWRGKARGAYCAYYKQMLIGS